MIGQFILDALNNALGLQKGWSSPSVYITATIEGAIDAFWGGGLARTILISVIENIIKQLINMITKDASFSWMDVFVSAIDGLLDWAIAKLIKVPRYIRDIKAEAKKQFIKGTRKLNAFLKRKILVMKCLRLALGEIKKFFVQFVNEILEQIYSILNQVTSYLKSWIWKKDRGYC